MLVLPSNMKGYTIRVTANVVTLHLLETIAKSGPLLTLHISVASYKHKIHTQYTMKTDNTQVN